MKLIAAKISSKVLSSVWKSHSDWNQKTINSRQLRRVLFLYHWMEISSLAFIQPWILIVCIHVGLVHCTQFTHYEFQPTEQIRKKESKFTHTKRSQLKMDWKFERGRKLVILLRFKSNFILRWMVVHNSNPFALNGNILWSLSIPIHIIRMKIHKNSIESVIRNVILV